MRSNENHILEKKELSKNIGDKRNIVIVSFLCVEELLFLGNKNKIFFSSI